MSNENKKLYEGTVKDGSNQLYIKPKPLSLDSEFKYSAVMDSILIQAKINVDIQERTAGLLSSDQTAEIIDVFLSPYFSFFI